MGFFADQRIKKGQKASISEDKEALPKNYAPKVGVPQVLKDKGKVIDLPVNQAAPSYNMDSKQQKRSKLQPE